MTAPNTKHL